MLLQPHYDQRTELRLFLCIQTETGPSLSQPVLRKKLEAETQILFLRILYIIIPWSVVACLTCCWTNSGIASTSRMKLNFKTVRPFKELSFRILKKAWWLNFLNWSEPQKENNNYYDMALGALLWLAIPLKIIITMLWIKVILDMWVEFVVGSCRCSKSFSPGPPVFLPPQEQTF